MKKLTIDALDLRDKRTLMRVDFNVPLTDNLEVADDTRIRAALPSITKIVESGGMPILMSHLGRPRGKVVNEMRLNPVAKRLSELLHRPVRMAPDCIGAEVEGIVAAMRGGDVVLLENLRFHKGETDNDAEFSQKLARLGDIYLNDAFGTAHRAHASTVGITAFFTQCAAGYLMQKELDYLGRALSNPERPFLAIMGGAKISDKIELIRNLLDKLDTILIGGGMTYTFYRAQGFNVGNSLVEEDKIELAGTLLEEAEMKQVEVCLPIDSLVARDIADDAEVKIVQGQTIDAGWAGVDIGPGTIEAYRLRILASATVIWNGPLGIFEKKPFAKGTMAIAHALADATAAGVTTILGGGDSVSAIKKAGLAEKVSHVSTGGGASMEFLSGISLPGVEALTDIA